MAKLTKKQKSVIDNLRKVEGFNNFDPDIVVEILTDHANLWVDGIYDPQMDDTLYLYPRKGKEHQLEVMAYKYLDADEVDYMPLIDYFAEPKEKTLAKGGLRIWWD